MSTYGRDAMVTPTTPTGLSVYDHLDPADAAARAWVGEGRHPAWHRGAQDQTRAAMPVLARALERLADTLGRHGTNVGAVVDVHGDTWRRAPGAQGDARRQVRLKWAEELHKQGLRPLGWPPIREEALGDFDVVRLSIRGVAVPADQ